MQEVWDGKDWNPIDDANVFTTIPVHTMSGAVSSAYTTSIQPSSSNGTLTESRKEDLYYFLKENLRVAEYLREDGKLDYVQLEIREGEGFLWEPIRRIKIKP
jgi:hypothetical protein